MNGTTKRTLIEATNELNMMVTCALDQLDSIEQTMAAAPTTIQTSAHKERFIQNLAHLKAQLYQAAETADEVVDQAYGVGVK